jgi:hypothetical protein
VLQVCIAVRYFLIKAVVVEDQKWSSEASLLLAFRRSCLPHAYRFQDFTVVFPFYELQRWCAGWQRQAAMQRLHEEVA